MMKKLIGIITIVFCCMLSARGQEAKTLFVNMPDSLSPLLTAVNRADCIDFLESKMRAQVDNRFDGKSEMTALGADFISIQLSPQTTWQMKLLPVNDSTRIICTVATACAPVCDSDVRFYTSDWKELPAASFLQLPSMESFLSIPDSANTEDLAHTLLKADMLLRKATLANNTAQLSFQFTTPEYMGEDATNRLKPFLHSPLVYIWSAVAQRFEQLP